MDYESFFRMRGATQFLTAGKMPCKGCGRCCKEERAIGLFPSDICRISKALKISLSMFNVLYLEGTINIGTVRDEKGNKISDSTPLA